MAKESLSKLNAGALAQPRETAAVAALEHRLFVSAVDMTKPLDKAFTRLSELLHYLIVLLLPNGGDGILSPLDLPGRLG